MAYSKTEKLCFELAEPVAAEYGCYIYDIEYVKEGSARFLRIFADKNGGINIDECEKISREISALLDEKDPIKENYILEVSSPGIERKLKTEKHFKDSLEKTVDIGLYKAVQGSKLLTGTLKEYENGVITAEVFGEPIKINQEDTSYVKLHFEF